MKTEPKDPATGYAGQFVHNSGLTKREYFAAAALKGLLANPNVSEQPEDTAENAVCYADELIKALNEIS